MGMKWKDEENRWGGRDRGTKKKYSFINLCHVSNDPPTYSVEGSCKFPCFHEKGQEDMEFLSDCVSWCWILDSLCYMQTPSPPCQDLDGLSMKVGGQSLDVTVFNKSPESCQAVLSDLLAQTQHAKNIMTAFSVFPVYKLQGFRQHIHSSNTKFYPGKPKLCCLPSQPCSWLVWWTADVGDAPLRLPCAWWQ